MNCKFCGAPLAPDMKYCNACGRVVEPEVAAPTPPIAVEPPIVFSSEPAAPVAPPIPPAPMPGPMPGPIPPAPRPMPPVPNIPSTPLPTPPQPVKNKKNLMIIFGIIALILVIGISVYVGAKFLKTEDPPKKDVPAEEQVVVSTEYTLKYNGYDITVPNELISDTESSETGDLYLSDESQLWLADVYIDYQNGFVNYQASLTSITEYFTGLGATNVTAEEKVIAGIDTVYFTYTMDSQNIIQVMQKLDDTKCFGTIFITTQLDNADEVLGMVVKTLATATVSKASMTVSNITSRTDIKSIIK